MACTTFFVCDFEGCVRALDEHDVTQIHLSVHGMQIPDDLEPSLDRWLDLCDEHVNVVLARMLGSTTGNAQ